MDFKSITSHEEACKVLNKDASLSTTTDAQLVDIANAINSLTGFKADFNNSVLKWRPFFYMDSSGFRFSCSYCDLGRSYTLVGSHLCDIKLIAQTLPTRQKTNALKQMLCITSGKQIKALVVTAK